MLQKLSEVQNLVLFDDWVVQTNGLLKAKALSYVEDDIQQGTADGLVFLL